MTVPPLESTQIVDLNSEVLSEDAAGRRGGGGGGRYEEEYLIPVLPLEEVTEVLDLTCVSSSVERESGSLGWRKRKWEQEEKDRQLAASLSTFSVAVLSPAEREEVKCEYCLESFPSSSALNFGCGHFICSSSSDGLPPCVFEYFSHLVEENKVGFEELVCPVPSCRLPVSHKRVSYVFLELFKDKKEGKRLYDKYLHFCAKNWRPRKKEKVVRLDQVEGEEGGEEGEEGEEEEEYVECPNDRCSNAMIISSEQRREKETVACPDCGREFCPSCFLEAHRGLTCAQLKEKEVETSEKDDKFEETILEKGWKRCPKCKAVVEKVSGCNFMTCCSKKCANRTFFCYLCACLLTSQDHNSHFIHDGSCRNVGRGG